MARLVVITKGVSAAAHELGEGWATLGRADGNTFQIVEASISGRHCEVRLRGEELVVRDLLSTNGTFVGGQKISEAVVKTGQTLRLGDVELRFETSGGPASPGTSFISKMLMTQSAAAPKPAPVAAAKTEVVPAGGEAEKKFQVLFVDDSMAFLELFGDLCAELSNQTWKIHTATSADAALALLRERPVDLVLLDITMPMLDGLQLLGIINRRYPGAQNRRDDRQRHGRQTRRRAGQRRGTVPRKTADGGGHEIRFQRAARFDFLEPRRFHRLVAASGFAGSHPGGMQRPPFLHPRNPQPGTARADLHRGRRGHARRRRRAHGRGGVLPAAVAARRRFSSEAVQGAAAAHHQHSLGISADGRRPRHR